MERQFEELTTAEIANLTRNEQEEYAKVSDYTIDEIIAEVENCRNIIKRLG